MKQDQEEKEFIKGEKMIELIISVFIILLFYYWIKKGEKNGTHNL